MNENARKEIGMSTELLEPVYESGWLRIIDRFIEKGNSIEQLGKLLELQQQWEKDQARKAFNDAFSKFKAEAPSQIARTGRVDYPTKGGQGPQVAYSHVELHKAVEALVPKMSAHGLSHSWEVDQGEAGLISVTCRLEHVDGHSKSVTLRGMPDGSGSKNPIQAIGSAVYYLERYTFLAVLGIAQGDDDDGTGGPSGKATPEQVKQINELIGHYTPESSAAFYRWLKTATGAEKTADIPAEHVAKVIYMIDQQRKKEQNGNGKKPAHPDYGPEAP